MRPPPPAIRYRATTDRRDLHRCQSLLRAVRGEQAEWRVPVVLAEAGPHLVGAIGTLLYDRAVVGGPLVLDPALGARAPRVAYRLGEVYEQALAACGVTFYLCHVPASLAHYATILDRLGFQRIPTDEPGTWFKRTIAPWGTPRRARIGVA
jgi:hypothetical protein